MDIELQKFELGGCRSNLNLDIYIFSNFKFSFKIVLFCAFVFKRSYFLHFDSRLCII